MKSIALGTQLGYSTVPVTETSSIITRTEILILSFTSLDSSDKYLLLGSRKEAIRYAVSKCESTITDFSKFF
jgi:hypothetical protein